MVASPATAQNEPIPIQNESTAYAGISAASFSEYLGSADQETRLLPYLSFDNFKGFDLFGPNLNYRLFEIGTGKGLDKWSLEAGPKISYQGGRDSDDSLNLTGFDDIGGSLPLGGYIKSTIGPVGLGVTAGKDIIKGHGGFTADAAVGTFYRAGNFAIQPSLSVSWANSRHNERFFGVSNAQSLNSPLAAYDIGSGIYAYSANVVSWVEIQDKYALAFIATYRNFTGDAKDSPILRADDGSTNGASVIVSFSRKFDLSKY